MLLNEDGVLVVRVLGSDAVKATATVTTSAPVDMLTVEMKYAGAAGNAIGNRYAHRAGVRAIVWACCANH